MNKIKGHKFYIRPIEKDKKIMYFVYLQDLPISAEGYTVEEAVKKIEEQLNAELSH